MSRVDACVLPAAERCPIPDFYELQLKMERQGSSDVESMWSSSGGSPSKTKKDVLIAMALFGCSNDCFLVSCTDKN
ncbi:hypothetical protein IscW_ISCW015169 [Ixodes scapularis]|uniref:Uncharacterized protein n=1 Tax=Ixodes scapularis TaxID=6945 RepID=B7QMX4_IXOSC|nr:hypothetical protein IscW_ISCW015169 [Ixodes scapularis]|eukprot:XP_002400353.1 hypothetical protein IscW_ISCW015169 [Ixodes scapularis]